MDTLIYVDDTMPGITRRACGKGWAYYDPQGKLITSRAEKRRLAAIALPPAYVDAWYCPVPNGHILATGYDARGRKQYRYHPEFRTARECSKFDGCAAFGKLLPLLRERVEEDLRARSLTRARAVASVVRLLDLGALRVGNESYARANRSFGATTLRKRHARLSGRTLRLRFRAKGGKLREVALSDAGLIRAVRQMQDLPGQAVFQYLDEDGARQSVGSADVNAYLREAMGADFTAKNFRTWHASVIGLAFLHEADGRVPAKALLDAVADRLGNTPAVARASYIHPAVLALVERQEEWRAGVRLPRSTRWMTRTERALLELLETGPSAQELLAA